jgi:hypothetical protein
MIVKAYHLFSVWVFVAAAAYGLRLTSLNPFPLVVLAAIGGAIQFVYRFSTDVWWHLLLIVVLHALPFVWVSPDYTMHTLRWNLVLPAIYVLAMTIGHVSILEVYRIMLTETPGSFLTYMKDKL